MSYFSRQAAVKAALHREPNGRFASPDSGAAFAEGASHFKHVTMTGRVADGKRTHLPPIDDGVVLTQVDGADDQG